MGFEGTFGDWFLEVGIEAEGVFVHVDIVWLVELASVLAHHRLVVVLVGGHVLRVHSSAVVYSPLLFFPGQVEPCLLLVFHVTFLLLFHARHFPEVLLF